MKSFFKAAWLVLGLFISVFISGLAGAVSMGGADLSSALGQPLRVKVAIETASRAEANSLSARLATPDTFKAAGMDYPFSLPPLNFELENDPVSGGMVLKISSTKPINEPFVSLLVEVSWSSGKLLREYTLLLDPPGYAVGQPTPSPVMPIEPVIMDAPAIPLASELPVDTVPVDTVAAESGEVSGSEPVGAALSMPEKIAVAPIANTAGANAAAGVVSFAEVTQSAADAIPTEQQVLAEPPILTKRGDTLAKLAMRVKPPEVSLERMLLALYRANAKAFDGKNMNRLKVGRVVRIPEMAEINTITQGQAKKEMRIQVADWHAYRQKLAAATQGAPAEETAKQETSGKIGATVADKAPVAKETAKEVVKLSKGEAPSGDQVSAGGTAKTLSKQAQAEEATAQANVLKENKERAALLEKNKKDIQLLAEMKAKQASEPAKLGNAVPIAPLEILPKVPAASAVKPAKPMPPPPPPVEEPSFLASLLDGIPTLDELLEDPIFQLAGAALLLAVGGLIWSRRGNRGIKKKLRHSGSSDDTESTERFSVPVASSPDTGDFTRTSSSAQPIAAAAVATGAASADVDPISEAELFLTFGRDQQAEDVLKEALLKTPNNAPVLLKLLSIYAARHDTQEFSKIALKIKDLGDAGNWEKVITMGRRLEPANPVYGGGGVASALDTVTMSAPPKIMFEVGGEKEKVPIAMDLDLGFDGFFAPKVNVNATQVLVAPPTTLMDFDITASPTNLAAMSPGDILSTASDMSAAVLDVTASAEPSVKKSKSDFEIGSPAPKKADDGMMEFTLDFPISEPSAKAGNTAMNIGLSDIGLSLDMPSVDQSAAAPIGEETKDTGWHDVATKIDLAKAYKEMGDGAAAKDMLEEVLREGDEQQRAEASNLLQQL